MKRILFLFIKMNKYIYPLIQVSTYIGGSLSLCNFVTWSIVPFASRTLRASGSKNVKLTNRLWKWSSVPLTLGRRPSESSTLPVCEGRRVPRKHHAIHSTNPTAAILPATGRLLVTQPLMAKHIYYHHHHRHVLQLIRGDFKHHLLWGWMYTANHHYVLHIEKGEGKVLKTRFRKNSVLFLYKH